MGLFDFLYLLVQIQQGRNSIVSAHVFLCVFAVITIIESHARAGKVYPGTAVIEVLFGLIVEINDANTLHFGHLLFRLFRFPEACCLLASTL